VSDLAEIFFATIQRVCGSAALQCQYFFSMIAPLWDPVFYDYDESHFRLKTNHGIGFHDRVIIEFLILFWKFFGIRNELGRCRITIRL